jgi:mannose-1-phosphate guanylyltransferase/mannose-6-phosphate isomerase
MAPKQFLSVISDETLIQRTISRIKKLIPAGRIFIVTNTNYIHEIKKQLSNFKIPDKNIILEPETKNTAPAVALVARYLFLKDPASSMVVLPSDHLIFNERVFIDAMRKAGSLAENDYLVTLGIVPKKAMTGYGYIKTAKKIDNKIQGYLVEKFIEKPSKEKVNEFIKRQNYFWNSGIFVWKTSIILEEIKRYLPQLYKKINLISPNRNFNKIWKKITPISIDYGILEKSRRVAMIPAKFDWSDVGSWQSLKDILKKDKSGRIIKADSLDIDSKNILVWSKDRFISTMGLKDLIIVDTPDALLVCRDDYSEKVKKIVEFLKNKKREEHIFHKTVSRPWGNYTILDAGRGFKIKLVEIEPKKRLSLQLHHKRAEHWVVVEGKAQVTYAGRIKYINSNQSIYIPANMPHRLGNPLKNKSLKIVEVQTGRYLKEDDIVRFKDDYQRA